MAEGPGVSAFAREFGRRATEVEDKLSKNDRNIVQYLREHLDELPFHTADSLATATGVSRAAVVRLAHRLGYEGFAELRDLARQEAKDGGRSPLSRFQSGGQDTQFDRKLQRDGENLALTQLLSEGAVAPAAETLATATSVAVVGNGTSAGLALVFHRMLHAIRPEVHFLEATFLDPLVHIGAGDVVVAFLFRRYARATVSLLDRARDQGASLLIVTDGGGQRFARDGEDQILVAATESPMLYQSMVAPIFLLEALVAATAAIDPERTQRTLEERERFNAEQGLLIG